MANHEKGKKGKGLEAADAVRKKIQQEKKAKVIEIYETTLGNVSQTCRKVGITRKSFYTYLNNDQEFKEKIQEIDESNIDFAESMLLKTIRDGNLGAICFYLKTKGKSRGYVETQQNDVNVNGFEQLMRSLPDPTENE